MHVTMQWLRPLMLARATSKLSSSSRSALQAFATSTGAYTAVRLSVLRGARITRFLPYCGATVRRILLRIARVRATVADWIALEETVSQLCQVLYST